MPSGISWFNFTFINIAFIFYTLGIVYYSQLNNIQQNWQLYRCNPMYMPLADNTTENFNYCIQNSMSGFMGYLMEPITFLTNNLGSMVSGISNEVNMVRAMFNKIRNFLSEIIGSIMGIFLNLIIEFQRIIIGLKDLMAKTIGILVTFMYIMDGAILTMESMWNGPSGQLVRALGCFVEETMIDMKDGSQKSIKELELEDELKGGSIVDKIIKINNKRNPNQMFEINNIKVSGSHYIFDDKSKKYMKVEEFPQAKKIEDIPDVLYNLCTSDHTIFTGNYKFWDWDDDCFSN
jgi:hypothetical protein